MELHSGFILEDHFTPSDLVVQLYQCSEEEGYTPGIIDRSSLSINTQSYPSLGI